MSEFHGISPLGMWNTINCFILTDNHWRKAYIKGTAEYPAFTALSIQDNTKLLAQRPIPKVLTSRPRPTLKISRPSAAAAKLVNDHEYDYETETETTCSRTRQGKGCKKNIAGCCNFFEGHETLQRTLAQNWELIECVAFFNLVSRLL